MTRSQEPYPRPVPVTPLLLRRRGHAGRGYQNDGNDWNGSTTFNEMPTGTQKEIAVTTATLARPRQSRPATYLGGPLDGQKVQRDNGQWPMYLDDDGEPVRTFYAILGDRLRRYTYQERYDFLYDRWERVYVHQTAWDNWGA